MGDAGRNLFGRAGAIEIKVRHLDAQGCRARAAEDHPAEQEEWELP